MDREQAARQIAAKARANRTPTPGWLWALAIVVAVVCVGSLAVGWLTASNDPQAPAPLETATSGTDLRVISYVVIAAVLGISVGIAIGRRSTRP